MNIQRININKLLNSIKDSAPFKAIYARFTSKQRAICAMYYYFSDLSVDLDALINAINYSK